MNIRFSTRPWVSKNDSPPPALDYPEPPPPNGAASRRSSSGNLAKFAAMRRASSRVSRLVTVRRLGSFVIVETAERLSARSDLKAGSGAVRHGNRLSLRLVGCDRRRSGFRVGSRLLGDRCVRRAIVA